MSRDDLYAGDRPHVADFAFDEQVARVFPDMIRRSVPGYETLVALLGVIARQYVQPGTRAYDLGCSLGASTLSMARGCDHADVTFVAVDSSPEMTARCREHLAGVIPDDRLEVLTALAQETDIRNASLVAMNFTMQFLPPGDRDDMAKTIHDGLIHGGALVLSEKVRFEREDEETMQAALHADFKRMNGYSELEISQKRTALENVMRLDTVPQITERLHRAGFSTVATWFQSFNFVSLLAVRD